MPELPVSLVCNASRTDYKTINDESGVIVQSTQGSFAIRIAEKNPARSILLIPCELNSLNTPGSRVLISGNVKNLGANEYLPKDFKNSNSYFLEITKIVAVY